jgi:glycosyltransferase involved in cell wall biosynthesis
VSRNAYDWQYGGAEQFTLNFAKAARSEGVRTIVISRVPELLKQCRAEKIGTFTNLWLKNETHRRWMAAYYLLWPVLVGQYIYVIWRYRADVLLLGSRDDQIFGTIAAWVTRRPAIWVDHADMKGVISQPFRFLRSSYFWALARARSVVAVSAAEREKIFANLPARYQEKFAVINNGAHLAPATALERPAKGKVVVFVGRIEADKGILDLMKAIPAVLQHEPDTQFWLVGKGQAEEEVQQLISDMDGQGRVKLLGHLERVGAALLAGDVFVYPTHHDASPLAPVEAMQAGLPVVATKVGGIPEVVKDGECGVLVEPKSPKALADALIEVLGDALLYRKLKAGAVAQGEHMQFDRVVKEQYLPLLRDAREA